VSTPTYNHRAALVSTSAELTLLDVSRDAILARDGDDVITFWNRSAEDLYGWRKHEAIGRRSQGLLQTAFPKARTAIIAEFLREGRWEGELVHTARSGSKVVVESRWSLERNADGAPSIILQTDRDVGERSEAHAALVQSEFHYRTIFETAPIAICQQDWSRVKAEIDKLGLHNAEEFGRYLDFNPEFATRVRKLQGFTDVNTAQLRLFGASSKEQFLRATDEAVPDDPQSFSRVLMALARGDTFCQGERDIKTFDGRTIPILWGMGLPAGRDGLDKVLVYVIDLTERNKAQQALLAAQAELARAGRLSTMGEMSASIAHEVNQPLSAIVTNGEAALRWIRQEEPNLDEVTAALSSVVADANRAGDIVSRVRDFLRGAPPKPKVLDIAGLIDEALLLLEQEVVRHKVLLRRRIAGDLRPVFADRIQLQQVVVNLTINAMHAMEANEDGERVLTIRAERHGDRELALEWHDTGHGITKSDPDQLFEPFFTTKTDGMGMGLAICRSTIEAHGGRLWASNHDGAGASFHFTLPIRGTSFSDE
jgi:PAS domain S-box-containing protein